MKKKVGKIQFFSNGKVLIATVDVSSTVHTGYWRCGNADIKPFEFRNNRDGFAKFWKRISIAKAVQKADKIIIGIESTGSYGEPLIHYLSTKRSVKMVQVNPMHTKRVKELEDNSPRKTDRKDPKVIADIIGLGHFLSVIIPQGAAAELRHLSQHREQTIIKRTASINQIHGLIAKIFPEFAGIMKVVRNKSSLYLLERYPTPGDIIALGLEALVTVLRQISRGKLGEQRAKSLYHAAQHSVGITEGITSIRMAIGHLVQEIQFYNKCIQEIENQMSCHLAKIPYSRNLLSIPGIGEVTAAIIIGEVGNFNDIHNSDALIKLAGLNLFEVSSGQNKGVHHISKRGRSLLRKIVYLVALNMVRIDKRMHDYYNRLISKGMKKMKALTAVSRKLFRIMFALVRDDTCYIPNYQLRYVA